MTIFAVANQKGGVGKTTSAINLAVGMALAGRRVLVVDLDPQSNLTAGLGLQEQAHGHPSIYDVIAREEALANCILERPIQETNERLHVAAGHIRLTGVPLEVAAQSNRERLLANGLAASNHFDVCVIDCPPTLGLLVLNAFVAAHYVLVPLQPEYWDLEGIRQLLRTIRHIQKQINPSLRFGGAFGTRYDQRRGIHVEYMDALRARFGDRLFKAIIRTDTKVSEAPSYGLSIFEYAPRARAADDYRHLTTEILTRYE